MTDQADCPPALEKLLNFGGFKTDELITLEGLCDYESYEVGQAIVTQGDPSHCMYVIVAGEVQVTCRSGDQEVNLATLVSSDFFGEIGLVDDGARSATVIVTKPARVLRIDRTVLNVLAGVQPSAAIHLLTAIGRSLVGRMRAGNQKYLDLILLGYKDSRSQSQ